MTSLGGCQGHVSRCVHEGMRQLLRRGSELGVEMAVLGKTGRWHAAGSDVLLVASGPSRVAHLCRHCHGVSCLSSDVTRCHLGMPHRGRLNVLANVLNKPVELILNEFQSNLEGHDEVGVGVDGFGRWP